MKRPWSTAGIGGVVCGASNAGQTMLLDQILEHYRAGRTAAATQLCCDQVVLGTLGYHEARMVAQTAARCRDYATAARLAEQALAMGPEEEELHRILGRAHRDFGDFPRACAHLQRVVELTDGAAEAHNDLGVCLYELGDVEAAIVQFRRAAERKPDYVDGLFNLGSLLSVQVRLPEAVTAFRRVLDLEPHDQETRDKLAALLLESGDFAGAERFYRELADADPETADVWSKLGIAQQLLGETDGAIASHLRAISLAPCDPGPLNQLAAVYREQGRFAEAATCYERARQSRPDAPQAYLGLAEVCCDLRELPAARSYFDHALQLAPRDGEVRLARALGLLRMADFAAGWEEFEARWETRPYQTAQLGLRPWTGEALVGQRILIHAEQGTGDTIHFARYLPRVQQLGAEVVFAVPPALLPLFAGLPGVEQLVAMDESIDVSRCDCYAGLLSLPRLLQIAPDDHAADVPYLVPSPELVAKWRERLRGFPGLRVGICRRGNPRHRRDRYRSLPAAALSSLVAVEGVTWIALEKESPQLQSSAELSIVDLSAELDQQGAFLDTAALLQSLDLVISCDTAVAHLAGALGVRTWLALEFFADWRWQLDRDDTPWYPTLRLFRQTAPGDWAPVMQSLQSALMAFRDVYSGDPHF